MFDHYFKKQLQNSQQNNFENRKSSKQFFMDYDGLHNIEHELVFTVKSRYNCGLNCQTCFLKGHWLSDDYMKQHTPNSIDLNFADVFKYWDKIAAIDDLRDLKNNHQHLFEWYKKYAPIMEFHTSDNGFFSQFDILTKELQFKEIGQISFSDYVLDKVKTEKILGMLSDLNDCSPIARINFVITKPNPENNKSIQEICSWLYKTDNTTAVYFHSDIRVDTDFMEKLRLDFNYKQPSCYYIEHSTNPPTKCNVFTETLHLRYNSWFQDLYTSMDENCSPFSMIENKFVAEKLLLDMLNEKIRIYKRNYDIMSEDNDLKQYFNSVANNLIVNDDFNFIPSVILSPVSKYYKMLISDGWQNTWTGLIKPSSKEIKSIIGWKQ